MNESESLGLHSYNQPSDPLSAREAANEERREKFSLAARLSKCTAPKKRYHPARIVECGEPGYYVWRIRGTNFRQVMCKECGEATTGNYKDELEVIK